MCSTKVEFAVNSYMVDKILWTIMAIILSGKIIVKVFVQSLNYYKRKHKSLFSYPIGTLLFRCLSEGGIRCQIFLLS